MHSKSERNVQPSQKDIMKLRQELAEKTRLTPNYRVKKRSAVAKRTDGFDTCKDDRLIVSD